MRRPPIAGPAKAARLPFADQVDLHASRFLGRDQLVTLLGAEMGNVYDCRRVIGRQSHHGSDRQRAHALGRLQDGQGAKKPRCIKVFVDFHSPKR